MKAKTMSGSDPAKKTVMILANSSGGLYDFRNDFVSISIFFTESTSNFIFVCTDFLHNI